VAVFIKPTSLNGGEGLAAGSTLEAVRARARAKRWSRGIQNQLERREPVHLSLFIFRVDDLKYHEHDHEQVTNSTY